MNTIKLRRLYARAKAVNAEDEQTYFYLCSECGQAVDIREWDQIRYHETEQDHEPIPMH